jgi:hypothetical protein
MAERKLVLVKDADGDEVPVEFTVSSGGWDDLEVTFRDPVFNYNMSYVDDTGEPQLALIVDFETDDPDVGDGGTIAQQMITIGKGWVQADGGRSVERESGRAKGFQRASYAGVLIQKCMEHGKKAMLERHKETGLTTLDAGFWDGLHAHFSQQEMPRFRNDGEVREKLLPDGPISWVGGEKTGAGATKPAKKAAVKKVVAKKPAVVGEEMQGIEGQVGIETEVLLPLRDAIIQVARTSESDEQFIMRCYDEVPGLDDDSDAMALVDDVESPGCIWLEYGKAGVGEAGEG